MLWSRSPFGVSAGSSPAPVTPSSTTPSADFAGRRPRVGIITRDAAGLILARLALALAADPGRFLFVHPRRPEDMLWAMLTSKEFLFNY